MQPSEHHFSLADFDFDLPAELIAQHPSAQRSASRLLDGRRLPPADHVFHELPGLLDSGDLLIFNNTRVIKARLLGHKDSGGAVEVLIERLLPGTAHEAWAHVRASKAPRSGSRLLFEADQKGLAIDVLGRTGPGGDLFHLRFPGDPLPLLEQFGHVPLPPYIAHADDADDERRYQTVFASRPGAVAAPTAALHFDQTLLDDLPRRALHRAEVTLHVGAGTFLPVRTESLADHRMHSEWFDIPAATIDAIAQTRARGGRVVAVGTTTLRALESSALASGNPVAGARETDIFITPGFEFRVVDRLVTNFHLPRSTLMMLVSAFAGHRHVMDLYREAIERRYRFFSYGDAMLLERRRN